MRPIPDSYRGCSGRQPADEPIGLLVPSRLPLEARMQALIQTGLVAWSGRKLAPITPVAEVRGRRTVADMLLEDRG